jgi:hypothetical protein
MLGRIDGKKFPKLEDLTKPKQQARLKTPAEMMAVARQWDAAVGR